MIAICTQCGFFAKEVETEAQKKNFICVVCKTAAAKQKELGDQSK
jgi:hypothetical protein